MQPGLIINAAAYTAVDKAESEPELAQRVNGTAPGMLAEEAQRLGARVVHYSTDYVFDGTKAGAYDEDDAPNPINAYGSSKLVGERAVLAAGSRHLVVRTSWVYGPRGRNFYLTIANRAVRGEQLRVVDDQRGVPTSSRFLAEMTMALVRRDASGLLHVVPSGSTSWYGFAREIVQLCGARSAVDPITSAQFPTPARRPANSVLSNARASTALGATLPDWRTLLLAVRESART